MTPRLVGRDLLPAALTLNQVLWQTVNIVGPVAAGVVIGTFGFGVAYAIDLVTDAGLLVAASMMRPMPPERDPVADATAAGWAAVKEGFTFVRSNRLVASTFAIDLVAMIFGMPAALFPILALTQFHRGAAIVGLLFAAPSAGALAGALSAGWVRRVRRPGVAVIWAVTAWGAAIAAFGFVGSNLPLALGFLALAGAADVISAIFRSTIAQLATPDHLRGRLSTIFIQVVTGGGPASATSKPGSWRRGSRPRSAWSRADSPASQAPSWSSRLPRAPPPSLDGRHLKRRRRARSAAVRRRTAVGRLPDTLREMSPSGTSTARAIESSVVVASNRGPVSFDRDERGRLAPRRGTGGLVTALSGVFYRDDTAWVSAAMTDGDRAVALKGRTVDNDSHQRMRYVVIPPDRYDGYYNEVSNRILWMAHHNLWDIPRSPMFDDGTQEAWHDFVESNRAFAHALAQEADNDPVYLIQDYHLCLVPGMLRELVPEAKIVHFSHTPFAGATYLRVLPVTMRTALLRGMAGADVLGFQSKQWAENYLLSARSLPELRVLRGGRLDIDGRPGAVRSFPVAVSAEPLRETANRPEADEVRAELRAWAGDSKIMLRVDRLEPSKNILRGFLAYELFLRRNPSWVGSVRFLCLFSPSREDVPEYQNYGEECLAEAERINARVRHQGMEADRGPGAGGLRLRRRGLRPVRRLVRESHVRRHEPRGDGRPAREPPRRCARALPECWRVQPARPPVARGQPVRPRRDGRGHP